jgi:hypothetical protein
LGPWAFLLFAMPKRKRPARKSAPKRSAPKATGPKPNKVTPVLYVHHIEPCLDLWVNRLGFTKTVEVPEGGRAGFVILQKGKVEVMYQTLESVGKDVPAYATRAAGETNLFVEVENIDAIERAVQGIPLTVARRKTFYGSTEIGIKDAGGNTILFAQMP